MICYHRDNKSQEVFYEAYDRIGFYPGPQRLHVGAGDRHDRWIQLHDYQAEKEAGKALVSTVLFDNESAVIHDRLPLEDVPPMTEKEYFHPRLHGAARCRGGAIHHIGNIHKYARREDVPEKTMFIITTDGYENASRRYDYETVRRMIERQRKSTAGSFSFWVPISTQRRKRHALASALTVR